MNRSFPISYSGEHPTAQEDIYLVVLNIEWRAQNSSLFKMHQTWKKRLNKDKTVVGQGWDIQGQDDQA